MKGISGLGRQSDPVRPLSRRCLLGKRRGLITPDYRLLASECCGIRNRGDSSMIVSAGAGEHTVPVRIHNPREITLLEIAFGEA